MSDVIANTEDRNSRDEAHFIDIVMLHSGFRGHLGSRTHLQMEQTPRRQNSDQLYSFQRLHVCNVEKLRTEIKNRCSITNSLLNVLEIFLGQMREFTPRSLDCYTTRDKGHPSLDTENIITETPPYKSDPQICTLHRVKMGGNLGRNQNDKKR